MSKQACLVLVLAAGLGCFGPESTYQGQQPINPQLKRPLALSPLDDPVWATPTTLYAYHNGIVEVAVDSTTLDYRGHVEFNFAPYIWTMSYDRRARCILLIYMENYPQPEFQAARVSLANQQVVIDEVLVDTESAPWGIAAWPGRPGVVYYGVRTNDGVRGFFWRRNASAESLLLAVELNPVSARGMAIDPTGRHLFFAQGTAPATFFDLDLAQANPPPVIIAQRTGGNGAVVPNPTTSNLVLLN